MIKFLILVTLIFLNTSSAYSQALYSKAIEHNAYLKQSRYFNIMSFRDSIIALGDRAECVLWEDSICKSVKAIPMMTWLDSLGNVGRQTDIKSDYDSLVFNNTKRPTCWINDSIFCFSNLYWLNQKDEFLSYIIYLVNAKDGKVIRSTPIRSEQGLSSGMELSYLNYQDGYLYIGARNSTLDKLKISMEIIKLDTLLKVVKRFNYYIPNNQHIVKFITSSSNNSLEIIGRIFIFKNDEIIDQGLFYMKLQDLSIVNKYTEYIDSRRFGFFSDAYTVYQEDNDDWVMGVNDVTYLSPDKTVQEYKPYIIRLSKNLDTLRWATRMYDEIPSTPTWSNHAHWWHTSMKEYPDRSGYLLAGDLYSFYAQGSKEYAYTCKVAPNGDSLWLRRYNVMNWSDTQLINVHIKDLIPYKDNTWLIAGYTGDRVNKVWRSWLIRIDEYGCLVPGCNNSASINDINSGKEKAFVIYPNPTSNDHIYLQSRISSSQDYHIGIYNLHGQELKLTKFRPQEGVQYIVDLPQEIPDGEYLLRINGKEFNHAEKLIITK